MFWFEIENNFFSIHLFNRLFKVYEDFDSVYGFKCEQSLNGYTTD